jgi:hypothetical protein
VIGGAAPRFRIGLAGPEDEAELRRLARETPLAGPVEVTLRREPDFFAGAAVEGPFYQVLAVRDASSSSRIVAMSTRSVRERYVHQTLQPVGYLGGLRIAPNVRGGSLLFRGFQELRRLHDDGRASFYLTTISDKNTQALKVLTSGRAGLPRYHELGRYLTFVLPAVGSRIRTPAMDVRPLQPAECDEWLRFVDETGRSKLFFPRYTAADLGGDAPALCGLRPEQIWLCRHQGQIVGTLAAWDQSSFRQTVVERYHGPLRWWRPLHNMIAPRFRWPRFPAPGTRLPHVTLALPLVRDDDADVLKQLVRSVQRALHGTVECLLLGLFERDPLVPVVRRWAVHNYVSRVYVAYWDNGIDPRQFENQNLYLELGCL